MSDRYARQQETSGASNVSHLQALEEIKSLLQTTERSLVALGHVLPERGSDPASFKLLMTVAWRVVFVIFCPQTISLFFVYLVGFGFFSVKDKEVWGICLSLSSFESFFVSMIISLIILLLLAKSLPAKYRKGQ